MEAETQSNPQESTLEPVVQPKEKVIEKPIAIKRPGLLWLIVLLLGCIFDFLFWKQ